jgi:hypothetical protein
MQPSCPGSRDLNWTGKGLKVNVVKTILSSSQERGKGLSDIAVFKVSECFA